MQGSLFGSAVRNGKKRGDEVRRSSELDPMAQGQGESEAAAADAAEAVIGQQQKGYAVELYFDPALENQVLKAWNVLARRQISTKLIEISARPHLTLLSLPSLDPLRLQAPLRAVATRLDPLPLSLSSVGAFPSSPSDAGEGGGVLFLAPTPSADLLNLHSQVCDALRKEGVELPEEFRPDSWVPYCSVAQDVPRQRTADAFCVLRDLKLPVSGYAMDIGLVEFSPVQEIFSCPLGSSSES